MKKSCLLLMLAVLLCFSASGCGEENTVQDTSPITFSVSLGNNAAYYNKIKEAIKEELGYEVEFVYQTAIDTTNAVRLEFKNNDLPADIVATASPVSEDYLRESALDLMSYTHLSDYFTYQKLNEVTNSDGTVYQLPFTTKLIGITYNKTLLDEMGWEEPSCYADMLELKQKCDSSGILFAVSAGVATGHGFNYLFHTMGTQWLSTLDGTGWINDFIAGKADISAFKEQAEYFSDWVENGLFGKLHDSDWGASKEYCQRRALFYFDLTNTVYSYEGDITDADGNVIGQVKDEYKTIPWISRDGSNNCYTCYDNMYLMLNKKLGQPEQADKLEKCIEILEFMTGETATSIFKELNPDGYVAVRSFGMDDTRQYAAYSDKITSGYLMPWYYSYFDNDSIVNVGQLVNNYIKDRSSSFDDIIEQLQFYRDKNVNSEVIHICNVSETLDTEDVARLNGRGALKAYSDELDQLGISENADIALIPYVKQVSELEAFSSCGVVSTKAYKGELVENDVSTVIPAKGQNVVGIHLEGSELKALINGGLSENDAVYPYLAVGASEIDDGKTYLVLVSTVNLNEGLYQQYCDAGKVLMHNGTVLSVNIRAGVKEILLEHSEFSAADLAD